MIILRETTVPSEYLDYASNKGIPLTNTELDSNFLTLLDIALNSFPKTGSEVENFVLTAEGSRFGISTSNVNLSASSNSKISSMRVSADEGIVINADTFTYNGSPVLSQASAADYYLPLSGGSMTGAITRNGEAFLNKTDTSWIRFNAGSSANSGGANLLLYGKLNESNPGIFQLKAFTDDSTSTLIGYPEGSLKWRGLELVRGIGGDSNTPVFINSSGVVQATKSFTDYLPLSGGWLTGHIRRNVGTDLTKGTAPSGSYYTYDCFSCIDENTDGTHRLGGWFHYIDTSRNSITYMQAYGFAAGSSTTSNIRTRVDVNNVTYVDLNATNLVTSGISLSSTAASIFAIKHSNETYGTEIFGGTAYNTSPSLSLYGSSRSSNAGTFVLRSGANAYNLSGTSAGVLTWSGPVVTASDDSTKIATTAHVKDCVPKSVGSGTKPVFTNSNGVVTASSSTVGSATNPIYLNAGTITATGGTWIKSSAASIAAKGYVQFSNGLILNWGTGKKSDNPITFAKAFTSACWSVQLTRKDGGSKDYAQTTTSVSTTGFTCNSYDGDSAVFYFFAIGK